MNRIFTSFCIAASFLCATSAFGWKLQIKNSTQQEREFTIVWTICSNSTFRLAPNLTREIDAGGCVLSQIKVGGATFEPASGGMGRGDKSYALSLDSRGNLRLGEKK
jgi:hypothetical protein